MFENVKVLSLLMGLYFLKSIIFNCVLKIRLSGTQKAPELEFIKGMC